MFNEANNNQKYFKSNEKEKSVHISNWPEMIKIKDSKIEEAGDIAIEIIQQVRQFKSKNGKSLKALIVLELEKGHEKILKEFLKDLKAVCSATEIKFGKFGIKFVE